ncbi:JAB domain-containing protein [Tsuneonella suprasediminis]|uniref:JAB domain-containing protein n=1 Tax=Tsuneonella suprasediminis TaxID=2306996 RepID=UPI0014037A7B|nr:JAB domain-containing protein [Tsuneonella suprasediminis]
MAELFEPFAGDDAIQLAERLIAGFGSLERILSASSSQLRDVAGGYDEACRAIAAARQLVDSAYREHLISSRIDAADPVLHRHLRASIGGQTDERLFVVFCDHQQRYLGDALIAEGSRGQIVARTRPLITRALALGASGLLLAHNHPSGECYPSEVDIVETRRLEAVCQPLEIALIDHLIVTRTRVLSMRLAGCI